MARTASSVVISVPLLHVTPAATVSAAEIPPQSLQPFHKRSENVQAKKQICKAIRIDKITHLLVTECGRLVKPRVNSRQEPNAVRHWRLVTCEKCLDKKGKS